MSLILAESWDGYEWHPGIFGDNFEGINSAAGPLLGPWVLSGGSPSAWDAVHDSPHGQGACRHYGDTATYNIETADQDDLMILGFRARALGAGTPIIQFNTAAQTGAVTLWSAAAGAPAGATNYRIDVYKNAEATYLGTTGFNLQTSTGPNYWNYIEIKVRTGGSGSIEVRIDGVTKFNLTGQSLASGMITSINLRGGACFDDLYLLNEQGTTNNDFLGDVAVMCLQPNGAGDLTQWVPSSGNNWDAVADPVSTDTPDVTNYVTSSTTNNEDLYTLTDDSHTSPYTVAGVVIEAFAGKDDTGSRSVAISAKEGSSHVQSADKALIQDTGISVYPYIYGDWKKFALDVSPSGAAWTFAILNALQAGIICRP